MEATNKKKSQIVHLDLGTEIHRGALARKSAKKITSQFDHCKKSGKQLRRKACNKLQKTSREELQDKYQQKLLQKSQKALRKKKVL